MRSGGEIMRGHSTRTMLAVAAMAILTVLPAHAQQGPIVSDEGAAGRPSLDSGWGPAYFIWSDQEGIHVRWSAREDEVRRFRGEIATDGTIASVRDEGLEPEDNVRRTGNTVSWEAIASTGYDGFVVALARSANWIRFSLQIDGRMAPAGQIFVGQRGFNPPGNPFTLRLGGEASRDRWPAAYRGQPPVPSQFGPAYFVWVEDDTWHVRWITRGGGRELSGLVSTDGRFNDFRRVQLEEGDLVARDQRLIGWEARGTGGSRLDGLDFRTTGERLSFTLLIDGNPVSPSQIFLGSRGTHPPRNPWKVTR
jgi:hypothetical protein